MIQYIIGGTGSGKSWRLTEQIARDIAGGETVIALVPEQYSYEFDRKLYHRLGAGAFNAIETHSFTSLARRIFQQYGAVQVGAYTDDLTKLALVEKAIHRAKDVRHALQYYEKQSAQGNFSQQFLEILTVLRRSGLSAEELYQRSGQLTGRVQEKLLDAAAILQEYERLLLENNRTDMLTDLTEAAALANGHDFFAGKTVYLDEFESFTPDQYEMLTVIFSTAKTVYLALRMERHASEQLSLFSSVSAAWKRLHRIARDYGIAEECIECTGQYRTGHADLAYLSQQVFRPLSAQASGLAAQHIHLLEAKTPVDEAEYICATIRRMLAADPTLHCRDIAVVSNQLEAYAGLFRHTMERYELPYHLDEGKSILHTPFMVYLLSLFGLLTMRHPDTELLLRCGKTGFVDCTWMELSLLENYCYVWSIEGKAWEEPFTYGEHAEEAEAVRSKLLAPLLQLRALCADCTTGAAYSRAIYTFLEQQEIGVRAAAQIQHPDAGMQAQLTQDFERVWESLMDILDVLAALYETESLHCKDYCALLQVLLRSVQHAIPPRTLDAVFIGSVRTSRLGEPKYTFIAGATEGNFPPQAASSSLFTERDREALSTCGIELGQPPELRTADEQLAVYKALSSATEGIYLTYALTDFSDQKCSRSAVLEQILRMFTNPEELLCTQRMLGARYYAVTKPAAYYHYVQDFTKQNEDIATLQALLCRDAYYEKRIESLRRIHSDQAFQSLQPGVFQQLAGRSLTMTATRLETFSLCPFHYFCQYSLKLYERRKIQFQAMQNGNLIHACMEQLLGNVPREVFLQMPPEELLQRLSAYAEQYWKEELGGDLGKNQRDLAALQHTIAGMTELAQHLQRELMQTDFCPKYFELEISDRNPAFPSPRFCTQNGERIHLLGKVDRVDLCDTPERSWVRVIDYKSGGRSFSLGNLLYGIDLQMLLYLFSITDKRSQLSHAAPAGILYLPAGAPQCTEERGAHLEHAAAADRYYKMNGLLVEDAALLHHMERTASGIYVPGQLQKDGKHIDRRSGKFLTEAQWKSLRSFVQHQVEQIADRLYAGEIAASPLCIGSIDACKRCSFGDVCGGSRAGRERSVSESSRKLEQTLLEQLEEIGKEAETHENMDDSTAGGH